MPYRGYVALGDVEIANSARVITHLGTDVPTMDFGFLDGATEGAYSLVVVDEWGAVPASPPMGADAGDWGWDVGTMVENPSAPGLFLLAWDVCTIIEDIDHPGLGLPLDSQVEVSPGLWTPPAGARIFGPGIFVHDQCWGDQTFCAGCRSIVSYDDSWLGQRTWLNDVDYRVELAPWYSSEIPESAEFGGVWLMDLGGLDSTPVERTITQASGNGAVAGPNRDTSRTVTFDALLFGCTNAGVEHGLKWLDNLLRATSFVDDSFLKYLTASPSNSAANPDELVRNIHNVVLTKSPTVSNRYNTGGQRHQHGSVYRVSWEMVTLSPYAYLPAVDVDVVWDQITRQPINWIHQADCAKPETCVDMPVMFSADCEPESIQVVNTPPPVCGGCLPVNAIDKYQFRLPTMDYAFRGRQTAVSLSIQNIGDAPLTLQAFLRVCGSDVRCEDNQYPLQIAGLPANATLYLDGVTGRFKMFYDELWRRPQGIVGTPNGAPWLPPLIDRETCWDFIIQSASTAQFAVSMSLYDREP